MIITYSVCVFVALGMQHAMRMRSVILSSVTCLALPYFFTSPYKGRDFQEKKLLIMKSKVSHSPTDALFITL
jgi:hypothetical protein